MVETAATLEIGPEPERLAPGSLVGEYEVERFVGAGAMGQVYAGKHPVIGKRVAIKVLRREMSAEPDAAIRFIREARAANQVAHPNVIDIFAFGTLPDARLYLVMDLVDGQSLRAIIRDGTLDLTGSLAILAQIADALDAAHAKGVVHRDLKPDNVMVADGGKVFVLDFGLAKLVQVGTGSAVGTGTLTARGTWIGTPGYMAPEQWSADGAVPASDRYALGVIAFELLSGQLPFSAPSLPAMMEQHFRAQVPALSSKGTVNASAAFDPVLARAMAKNPEARFPSAHAFVEALRDAAAGKLFRFPGQRRPWLPAGAAIGVLGLGVVGVIVARGRGDASAREADPPPPRTTYRVDVITQPAGARLARGETQLGMTPFPLDLAPGERAQIELRKPGYRSEHREVAGASHDDVVRVDLTPINGFEGVWALPDGELRAFARAGESVDVFKLDAVAGPRTFYRRFALVDTTTGVAFANDENVTDERGASDPSCQIPHHVEYHYDPAADALEVQPEEVETGRQNGHCYAKSRHMGSPIVLVRADRDDDGDTRHSRAPVGEPPKISPPPLSKIPASTRKPPPTKTPTKPTNADSVTTKKAKDKQAIDVKSLEDTKKRAVQAPNAPQPQAGSAPPPQPPPQQQAPPTKGGKQAK